MVDEMKGGSVLCQQRKVTPGRNGGKLEEEPDNSQAAENAQLPEKAMNGIGGKKYL